MWKSAYKTIMIGILLQASWSQAEFEFEDYSKALIHLLVEEPATETIDGEEVLKTRINPVTGEQ